LQIGDVIGKRFQLEAVAGEGGLAFVFRARDLASGQPVALKLLKRPTPAHQQRFEREAEVLATLDHPAIVRHVAHGLTASGSLYLAMEWLEGETLEQRLTTRGLTIAEACSLVGRVAAALGQAHRRGVVHRDLKPSNLFLAERRLEAVKVLDFGVARLRVQSSLSRTGVPIGTPCYMAPEQARGASVDARADVFALGSVLYECLTGRQAFSGDQVITILLRVMHEPAPPLRQLRPDIPRDLAELVARMLAKDPSERPADGDAAAAAIAVLAGGTPSLRPPPMLASSGLTDTDQQLVTVIAIADALASGLDLTLPQGEIDAEASSFERITARYGVRSELVLGAKVAWLSGREAAADQVGRAARCALELADSLAAPVAVASGACVVQGDIPAGDVVQRALAIAADAEDEPGVTIDEVSAGLLATRFALSDDRTRLFRERGDDEAAPLLLGRATPCVGRERELRQLEAIAEECASGSGASVVLVTADAGVGKSRLRRELLARLAGNALDFQVWSARGDPMTRGVPFELTRSLLRSSTGAGDAGQQLALSLRTRIASSIAPEHTPRVTEFFCSLLGLPLEQESVQLRAARQDPVLMNDQLRRAWLDYMEAANRERPLLLVLDDAHWADEASLRAIDHALEQLEEQRLLVLALARPELRATFPRLWQGRPQQEIRLMPLAKRASEQLVRSVLGAAASPELVESITAHAAGNAFLLEEIVRAAEGGDMRLPQSAIAAAGARLDRLEPDARRVLKAASVFGLDFWRDGVEALIGAGTDPVDVDATLATLEARELLARGGATRLAGHRQLSFRHPLLREAAYALLTQADRAVGHRLAADWLEAHGETNAAVIGEHFELGNEARRAIVWWGRAAEQALEASDLASAAAAAERGIGCGAHGSELGWLRLLQGEARAWLGDLERADSALAEALALIERGSARWCSALAELCEIRQRRGRLASMTELASELFELAPEWSHTEQIAWARTRVGWACFVAGDVETAERLRDLVMRETSPDALAAPLVCAGLAGLRGLAAVRRGDPEAMLEEGQRCAQELLRAGNQRRALRVQVSVGWSQLELGAHEQAAELLQSIQPAIDRLGLPHLRAAALHNLGLALARLGRFEQAIEVETQAIETSIALGDGRCAGTSENYLAIILIESGDPAAAEPHARAGVELLAKVASPLLAAAQATVSRCLLALGRGAEALEWAERAHAALDSPTGIESGEAAIRLSLVQALWQTSDRDRARALLVRARERLLERASAISDPAFSASFLERVPENARTLELARRWLSGAK
jgi:eukaryotic-like serine/threonine-protein kinase